MKRTSFCHGWEFSRDDGPFETVVVPHDAMLGNRRGPNALAASNSGYFYGATYRYRKLFDLTEDQVAGSLFLEFEGVYRDARVYVNNAEISVPPYGFIPFFVNLGGCVHAGSNVIEVACDNVEQPDCRWYSGAGIHRPVWLWEGPVSHIRPEGIRVTTMSIDPATVCVDVRFEASAKSSPSAPLPHIHIFDAEGTLVASALGNHASIIIPNAHLWSAESPYLYRCTVELRETDSPTSALLDSAEVSFGIRKLDWSPQGLFVNGRETLLQGGCVHCDNGVLGAASFPESEWRRITLLKQAGFNALRIAHNPAPTALLEACDHVGMYVIDEAWDMWFTRKSRGDYSRHFLDWCDFDLHRMTERDYNHPSVIMYSIGNEVADPLLTEGVQLERSLVELLHSLDPTRPVTCGLNLAMLVMEHFGSSWYEQGTGVSESAAETETPRSSLMFNLTAQAMGRGMTLLANVPGADKLTSPALDALDIAGYNYASARYALDARAHPNRIVVGSETFPYELASNWRKCQEISNLIGDFMWAAWDYLGEAGAGSWAYTAKEAGFSKPWPWLIAGSGALDILGQPNAAAALAGAVWKATRNPSIQVRPVNRMNGQTYRATWRGTDAIPSWSWQGCEGVLAHVEVYDGYAHSIALVLNGREVGKAHVHDCLARFSLPYEPGTLEAIGFDAKGHETGRSSLKSATTPLHLEAVKERSYSGSQGLVYADVCICGANGEVESNADRQLHIEVMGGTLLGFGSAQPAPTERFLSGMYTTYRGRALAVIMRTADKPIYLTVKGASLSPIVVML